MFFFNIFHRVQIKAQKPSLGHEEKKASTSSQSSNHTTDGIGKKKEKIKLDESELLFFGNTRFQCEKRR